jgi:hypothetical protein
MHPLGVLNRIGQTGSLCGVGDLVEPAVIRAPPSIPDGARFEERVFANAEGSRHYKLYVPSHHIREALPLVAMLHGCTHSPDDFAAGTRINFICAEKCRREASASIVSSENEPMLRMHNLLLRMFGRHEGVLGRLREGSSWRA